MVRSKQSNYAPLFPYTAQNCRDFCHLLGQDGMRDLEMGDCLFHVLENGGLQRFGVLV